MSKERDPESVVREIKRKTHRKYSSEEKIRIVLEGFRGEDSIPEVRPCCCPEVFSGVTGNRGNGPAISRIRHLRPPAHSHGENPETEFREAVSRRFQKR
jgi:transposase